MSVTFGRALYYPNINFTDYNWLKSAALYYNGIDRIVPGEDLIEEVDLINRLNDAADSNENLFVRDIDPRPYANDVSNEFLKFITKELADPRQRQHLIGKVSDIVSPNAEQWIHFHKMDNELISVLQESGIAIRRESFHFEDYLVLDPVVGSLYMSKLANHIAISKSLPLVSDDFNFQSILKKVQEDQNIEDIGFSMASVVFKTVIPKDIASVSTKQIIKFRKYYSDERKQFYNAINCNS